jgi:hypothetical protein
LEDGLLEKYCPSIYWTENGSLNFRELDKEEGKFLSGGFREGFMARGKG